MVAEDSSAGGNGKQTVDDKDRVEARRVLGELLDLPPGGSANIVVFEEKRRDVKGAL
jgi:hypothetical protein